MLAKKYHSWGGQLVGRSFLQVLGRRRESPPPQSFTARKAPFRLCEWPAGTTNLHTAIFSFYSRAGQMSSRLTPLAVLCCATAQLDGSSAGSGLNHESGLVSVENTVALPNGKQVVARKLSEADTGLTFRMTPLDVIELPTWPKEWPFTPEAFSRRDESDDAVFYSVPRLVYHIDEPAVRALTHFYKACTHTHLYCLRSHEQQSLLFRKANPRVDRAPLIFCVSRHTKSKCQQSWCGSSRASPSRHAHIG